MKARRWLAGLVAVAVTALAAAPVAPVAAAAPPTTTRAGDRTTDAELPRTLDALVEAGVTGAIVRVDDGRRVRTYARGVSILDPRTPIRPDGGFRVASISKSFVATVVLQLAAEHKLRLSDPVERWLPGLVPGGTGITVRQLLNHTSGIFNHTDDPAWRATFLADPAREWSARELVAIATAHPPVFQPGESWSYSNTNYLIAGMVAEAASGKRLDRLVADRITRPLRLSDTYLATSPAVRPGHIHGYLPPSAPGAGYVDTITWNPTAAGAAGAMVTTASDLARFYRALLSGRLLPDAQLREMLTTVDVEEEGGGYGLGIHYVDTPCGRVWGHTGGFPGYNSVAYQDRSGRRSAILFVATDFDQNTGPLGEQVLLTAVCRMMGNDVPATVSAARGTASLLRPASYGG